MNYQKWAEDYFLLGIKTTCISYIKNEYNIKETHPEKSPSHSWRRLQVRKQEEEELSTYPWDFASGIGAVLGFWHRCLDIDDCADERVLNKALKVLGLPSDYEWAVKTPNGYHVHFLCYDDLPFINNQNLCEGVLALSPNEEYQKKMSKIEVRLANHIVLPPTKINGKEYRFLYKRFPEESPTVLSAYKIYCLIAELSGRFDSGDFKINNLFFNAGHPSHGYPQLWFYDKRGEDKEWIGEFIFYDGDTTTRPLFLDIETTGLIQNPTDYSTYPRIIKLSYSVGYSLEVKSFFLKPDNFFIPKEIEKLTGLTQSKIEAEGIDFPTLTKHFDSLPYGVPVVCHNAEFDIAVYDGEYLRYKGHEGTCGNTFREDRQIFCTMKKYNQFFGGKYVTLEEMYKALFQEPIPLKLHDSENDVKILRDCFYMMNLLGYIKVDGGNKIIEDSNYDNVFKRNLF